MEVSYISTRALNEGTRLSVLKLQQRLLIAQKEMSSGRLADVGAQLGARTSETVSLRQEVARLNATIDTNSSVAGRIQVTQEALKGMSDSTQRFISTLIGARNSTTGPEIAKNEGESSLAALIASLNTTFAGQYVFGGENVDETPVADYRASGAVNRQAVDDAFLAFFGFAQDDARVASIVPSQMQTFIDTTFGDLFEQPQWSTNWSSASDLNLRNRISNLETVESSTNANADGYRKLAKAFTMLADLGVDKMTRETYQVLNDAATVFAGEAVQDLAIEQARLGVVEARIETVDTKMSAQIDIMTEQINELEAVDPFDAATRVNSLLTQVETAYSLTARIQRLTILNYL